jgi:hypothetical protein
MSTEDLTRRIRATQVLAAEDAVIASIPPELAENMRKAKDAFRARGGCKGCGSMVLAVHRGGCPTGRDDLY